MAPSSRLRATISGLMRACQSAITRRHGRSSTTRAAVRVRRRNAGCRREIAFSTRAGGSLAAGWSGRTRGRSRVYMKPFTKALTSVSAGMPSSANPRRKAGSELETWSHWARGVVPPP